MTDLDKLARSLTKAQREAVVNGHGSYTAMFAPQTMPLWHSFRTMNGLFYINLSDLGLALRNHLKGQNDGHG